MTTEPALLRPQYVLPPTHERLLLEALEGAYIVLGDITHQWKGRHTMEGQALLARMCHALAVAQGRDEEVVQNDYCNRSLPTWDLR